MLIPGDGLPALPPPDTDAESLNVLLKVCPFLLEPAEAAALVELDLRSAICNHLIG